MCDCSVTHSGPKTIIKLKKKLVTLLNILSGLKYSISQDCLFRNFILYMEKSHIFILR